MNRVFVKSMLKENPELLEMALMFNLDAPETVHDDWLSGYGKELKESGALEVMQNSPRGYARLSERLNALTGGSASGWFLDFSTPRRRMALLPEETILNLCTDLGLSINAKYVARTIFRPQVQALKATFGSRGYAFAVKRAPFLLGDCSDLLPPPDSGSGLVHRIREHGRLGFALCFASEPAALRDRVQMQLPAGFMDVSSFTGDIHETADRVWPVLRTLLMKEVAPEWAQFFV
ncbi:MAG: Yop proteins translocation protein K [Desulfovibrionales bacterium]|nr:Yop proteins translocation protein K [Desulfovibrionales bacterium]